MGKRRDQLFLGNFFQIITKFKNILTHTFLLITFAVLIDCFFFSFFVFWCYEDPCLIVISDHTKCKAKYDIHTQPTKINVILSHSSFSCCFPIIIKKSKQNKCFVFLNNIAVLLSIPSSFLPFFPSSNKDQTVYLSNISSIIQRNIDSPHNINRNIHGHHTAK